MPLSFRSENYGNIAFGFFNIESDMLLLEDHFFFADEFCRWMVELAKQDDTARNRLQCQVYHIEDPRDIGDLMGAIHGVRFKGFIGGLYTLFPFPEDPKAFKQNPEGCNTRKIVRAQIESVSVIKDISLVFHRDGQIHIGPFLFDKSVFHELLLYVWKGGYPGWKNEVRPHYVIAMRQHLLKSRNTFLKGVFSSRKI